MFWHPPLRRATPAVNGFDRLDLWPPGKKVCPAWNCELEARTSDDADLKSDGLGYAQVFIWIPTVLRNLAKVDIRPEQIASTISSVVSDLTELLC
jgi:hypothetical protein